MKKRIGQVLSLALVSVLLVSMLFPAFAADSSMASTSYWDWIMAVPSRGGGFTSIRGNSFGQVCADSSDGLHHSDSLGHVGGYDDNGRYTICTCKYCGNTYRVYASDLQQSYEAQVEELPAPGYNSDGKIIVYAQHDYFLNDSSGNFTRLYCSHNEYVSSNPDGILVSDCNNLHYTVSPLNGKATCSFFRLYHCQKLTVPITGTYEVLLSKLAQVYVGYPDGSVISTTLMRTEPKSTFYVAGAEYFFTDFVLSTDWGGEWSAPVAYGKVQFFPMCFLVTPDESFSSTTYNIQSRPGVMFGMYGDVNGNAFSNNSLSIVDETNNIYTNPATGETDTITDWSYNYEDRTYTLTLGGGTTTTVTYGDENVTIVEGNTTYNVYYLVDGGGSGDPGPDVPPTCNHQWTETGSTPATCVVPGSRTLTCSLCNETKTETVPAPGHKWVIRQEVKNEYDENGNQTQEGYTIWECSVCGEQQKTTDGTAPPGGGGSGSGSSGGVFSGIFGLLVDFLGFFWNTFRDFVGEGVKGFLTALMDGTSSIFGLLNPFNWGG